MAGSSSAALKPPSVGGSPTCDCCCCCCCRPRRDGVCTWPLPGAPAWCALLLLAPPAAPTGLSGWDNNCCTSTSSCWLLARLTGLLLPLLLGSELRPEPALPGRSTLHAGKHTAQPGLINTTIHSTGNSTWDSLQHAGAAGSAGSAQWRQRLTHLLMLLIRLVWLAWLSLRLCRRGSELNARSRLAKTGLGTKPSTGGSASCWPTTLPAAGVDVPATLLPPSPVKPEAKVRPAAMPSMLPAAATAPLPEVCPTGGTAPVVLPTAEMEEWRRVSDMMVLTTPAPCGVGPEGAACAGTGMSPDGEIE